MKKFTKLFILIAALVCCMAVLVGCGNVGSISIEKNEQPRLTYVLGQELDLSSGMLTVHNGKATEKIPLDSKGISVSGYEKDKLGTQKITITYKGASTQLSVNVIPRISVNGAVTSYFVGDSIDLSKGRVTVAKDDGTTFLVNLSDERITVEGFDSSKTGECVLTIRFREGSLDYSGSFKVNITDASDISFTSPRKLVYQSHETELDLSGSYFTVSGGSRFVEVTSDMVTGFNPSLATTEHRVVPLEQELTVSYAGKAFTFKITVYFSGVSLMRLRAQDFASLDWTNGAPALTEEQGENALDAMRDYFKLKENEKALVTEAELQSVCRVASVYGVETLEESLREYQNTIKSDRDGLYISGVSYSKAREDFEKLQNPDQPIYTYSGVLYQIKTELSYIHLYGRTSVEERLAFVYNPEQIDRLLKKLDLLLKLQTFVQNVPQNWNQSMLSRYETYLDDALIEIAMSELTTFEDKDIYRTLSSWRTLNDTFDIFYTYYLSIEDEGSINILKKLYLPGPLENLYEEVYLSYELLKEGTQEGLVDNTEFFYHYKQAIANMAVAMESSNSLYSSLLASLTYDTFITDEDGNPVSATFNDLIHNLTYGEGAYNQILGEALGHEKIAELWDRYLIIYGNMNADPTYVDSEVYARGIEEMLEMFMDLTPSYQYAFLKTLNPYYLQYPETAFGSDKETASYFTHFLGIYFREKFTDAGYKVYSDLMLSAELYARRFVVQDGETAFLEKIQEVEEGYALLGIEDRRNFDSLLGDVYKRYTTIYDRYDPSFVAPSLGAWEEKFAELAECIMNIQMVGYMLEQYPMYAIALSSYEKAESIVAEIMEAPEEIRDYFLYSPYTVFAGRQNETLEYTLFSVRKVYSDLFAEFAFEDGTSLYESYKDSNLKPFLADAYYTLLQYFDVGMNGGMLLEDSYDDPDKVVEAMNAFRQLSISDQALFLSLDYEMDFYYNSIMLFMGKWLTSDAANVGYKLLEVEDAYINYRMDPSGSYNGLSNRTIVKNAWEEFETEYSFLFEGNLESFNRYLKDMKDFYEKAIGDIR